MALHKVPVSLQDTVEKLYALFSQQASFKNNELHYIIEPDVPPYLIADETRLLQILSNLTSNAIKFTENGRIHIRVSQAAGGRPGKVRTLKVEVSDTGIGISQEDRVLLFNSFSQLDNSSTKAYGGTGLGLAISRELCRMMNGEIGLESEVGQGSTFWFTFEARETTISPHSVRKEEMDFRQQDYFDGRNPLILLVDDNQINRKVASEILVRAGSRVKTASNGKEALRLMTQAYQARQWYYDLILMDIQMPDMDGITVTAEIRKMGIHPLPPIVAMTAYSMSEDRERFMSQGLDDYISKPITAQSLISKVKEWLADDYRLIKDRQGNGHPVVRQEEEDRLPPLDLPPLASDMPVINAAAVAQLKKYGGLETVQAAFEDFAEEAEQQLNECVEAATRKEYQPVMRHLHTLKGNAGTLGLQRLAHLAAGLEDRLKKNEVAALLSDLRTLRAELGVFRQYYPPFLLKTEGVSGK
jgi:CheY-like chemotaxis protein/HPt (histidine-containing phosphotransfer) domain-containing protein/two-component sensor histidine kinase